MRHLMLASALLGLAVCATVAGAASEMFRKDAQHRGVYRTQALTALHGVKWQFHTGGKVVSSPALVDGTIYIGSGDGSLYALDAATGKPRWHYATKGAVDSSPAVADGTVYFVSRDGNCYAVSARSGKLKWAFHTEGEKRFGAKGLFGVVADTVYMEDPWDFYLSSPAVAGGLAYFGSGDGSVYAVDAKSGKQVWRFRTEDVVHSSPVVGKGTVYVGSWDATLYALDARTGQERWRYQTGKNGTIFVGIVSSPTLVDGVLYFGARDAKLHAVVAATGKERWAAPIANGNWVISSPAVANGVVYFGTSDSHRLMGLDIRTGQQKLELPLGMFLFSSPAVIGDIGYIGSMNGRLYAVDLRAGKELWYFETEASAANVQGARNPDGTKSDTVFTQETWTPEKFPRAVERVLSLGSVLSSPVVEDGVVYFGSTDGSVYALY